VRSAVDVLGLEPDFYSKIDMHVPPLPRRGIPKDGAQRGDHNATSLV